jgi:hypothetical protein
MERMAWAIETGLAPATVQVPMHGLGKHLVDNLTQGLLNDGGLRLASREDFERVVADLGEQTRPEYDDKTTASIGRLNAWTTSIYGEIYQFNGYHLTLRAVDVETGDLLAAETYPIEDPLPGASASEGRAADALGRMDEALAGGSGAAPGTSPGGRRRRPPWRWLALRPPPRPSPIPWQRRLPAGWNRGRNSGPRPGRRSWGPGGRPGAGNGPGR